MALQAIVFSMALAMSPGTDAQVAQERTLDSGDQLAAWCVDEMRARYAAKGITTYGSAISHRVEGNSYVADVRLSVEGDHRRARCAVPIGGRERFASFVPEDQRIR
jgi:hypothetical protein